MVIVAKLLEVGSSVLATPAPLTRIQKIWKAHRPAVNQPTYYKDVTTF